MKILVCIICELMKMLYFRQISFIILTEGYEDKLDVYETDIL